MIYPWSVHHLKGVLLEGYCPPGEHSNKVIFGHDVCKGLVISHKCEFLSVEIGVKSFDSPDGL